MRYGNKLISEAKALRLEGKTYTEIKSILNLKIPKSTFVSWFRGIKLPSNYEEKIRLLNFEHLKKARLINIQKNKERRTYQFEEYQKNNKALVSKTTDKDILKIALAMLWLGEGFKTRGTFGIGSSDARIIVLFMFYLKKCYDIDIKKVRCTLQCRADQNISELESYWMKITDVPKGLFYKARIDPRTVGKATIDKEYKGVLRVDYFDVRIQDEMATIVNMLYNQISNGPVVYW